MVGVEKVLIHKWHLIARMIEGIGGPGGIPVAEIHHWDAQEVQEGPVWNVYCKLLNLSTNMWSLPPPGNCIFGTPGSHLVLGG